MTKNRCNCKIKGGGKCGVVCVEGKKYCTFHAPKKQQAKITTYALKNYFDGEQSVKVSGYKDYLQSSQWKEKADNEKIKNPNCSLCNRKGILHVHHRTYVRCGSERENDLVVLCSDCHALFHSYYEYDGRVGYFKKKQ